MFRTAIIAGVAAVSLATAAPAAPLDGSTITAAARTNETVQPAWFRGRVIFFRHHRHHHRHHWRRW
jgi:hypothetical protein